MKRRDLLTTTAALPIAALPLTAVAAVEGPTAADMIERCRVANAAYDAAEAEHAALYAQLPEEDVILRRNRTTGAITYARTELQVNAHFDSFPDWIYSDREVWRAAKLEEVRQWTSRRDAAADALGLGAACERADRLCGERYAALDALCAHQPRSWDEARQIAAYVIADDDRWMGIDLLDAWTDGGRPASASFAEGEDETDLSGSGPKI